MKISKLFHALYASLLLAPLVAVGVSCSTVLFNEKVAPSVDEVTISYKYETNDPNDDLVDNNIYHLVVDTSNASFRDCIIASNYLYDYTFDLSLESQAVDFGAFMVEIGKVEITYTFVNFNTFETIDLYSERTEGKTYTFDFVYNEPVDSEIGFNFFSSGVTISSFDYSSISSSYIISSVSYSPSTSSVQDIFYTSLDKVFSFSAFSFANSGVAHDAVSSATSLFGVESVSPINSYLTYWLDISLIWLIFDVVMYVPQTLHNLIDKAVNASSRSKK